MSNQEWHKEFEWIQVRHFIQGLTQADNLPDLNAVLFMIGLQELGHFKNKFSKEEKQDLMHLGACRLLSEDEYYEFEGRDEDGWPHYKSIKPFEQKGVAYQEQFLKEKAVNYFSQWAANHGTTLDKEIEQVKKPNKSNQ